MPEFKQHFPAMLKPLGPTVARRQTLAKLDAQGLSRRDPALVRQEFLRHLDSLEARLDGKTWLDGESLSIADVAVAAMLWQFLPVYTAWHAKEVAARPGLTGLIRPRAGGGGVRVRHAVWLGLIGCATTPKAAPTAVTEPTAIAATRCGDVVALFRGPAPDGSMPLPYSVESLAFGYPDGVEKAAKPTGTIAPRHRSLEGPPPSCN